MPLARILTLSPEQADDFAQQLYDLGFEVEVVSPHEQSLGPADLEIEFAICDQQHILARAAAIATQLQAEIVVFPKAIPPLPKPIPTVGDLEREFTERPEESLRTSEAMMETSPDRQGEADHIHEYDNQVGARNQTTDAARPATRNHSAFGQSGQWFREGFLDFRQKLFHGIARANTALSALAATVANRTRTLRDGFKSRLVQARADRERRLAETRKQEAEAAQRAAVLEQERQTQMQFAAAEHERVHEEEATLAVEMQQQEIVRIRAENERLLAEIERLRTESKEQVAALESARRTAEEQQAPHQPSVIAINEPVKAAPRRTRQLRGALAGAVTAGVLFLVGMILANFHTVTPVSRDLNSGSVEEQVPFGATTVHGAPGVTVGGPSTPKPTPVTTAPQPQEPPQAQPQPVKSTPAPAKPSPEWHHFRRTSNGNQDNLNNVNDDVVVRHFGQPKPITQTAQQRAGVKRYSDE